MVLWILLTTGLITLVHGIGIHNCDPFSQADLVEANGFANVISYGNTYFVKDPAPLKHKYVLNEPGSISITFYNDFNDSNKEFKVSLYRGFNKSETVCIGSFNYTLIPYEENNCRMTPATNHVTFYMWGLSANNTDIYYFQKEVLFPPPYTCKCDNGTIIHVKEPTCIQQEMKIIQQPSLSIIIALGCFVLYSIIITVAYIYFLTMRRRTRIQQSEYINVVPRRPRPPMSR